MKMSIRLSLPISAIKLKREKFPMMKDMALLR